MISTWSSSAARSKAGLHATAELLELSVGQDDQGWFVAGQDDQVGTQIQAEV
jgi:hypothetical protein